MNKLTALLHAFRKGSIVANPEAWKKGQITVSLLSGAIIAVLYALQVYGVSIPAIFLLQANIDSIATILLLINSLLNPIASIVSTEKIGMRSKSGGTGTRPKPSPLTGSN